MYFTAVASLMPLKREIPLKLGSTARQVRSCSIACEHLSAKAMLTFLHRWQMNMHEQSWPRTFHTTKEILFVKLSDGDDELVSQLRAMANTTWLKLAMIDVY